MRLTLRTLLAWIDDTLPPAQVREIGNQVAESPFAQDLVERIRRVTRQRRLTVPKSSGPEWIDPNFVAGYLDNDLDPEQVAELEKQCLSIDVCLAEVASVHQILSLLGQRAKVPAEAKERMYQLVKGREATVVRGRVPSAAAASSLLASALEPWTETAKPKRLRRDRALVLAGCLASLLAVLVSSWYALKVPNQNHPTANVPAQVALNDKGPREMPLPEADMTDDMADEASVIIPSDDRTVQPSTKTANIPQKSTEPAKESEPTAKEETAAVPLAPGSVGQTLKGDDLLLRFDDEKREWERLTDSTPLNASDRLVTLAPCQSTARLISASMLMLGGAELTLKPNSAENLSQLAPRMGRFKFQRNGNGTGNGLILELGDAKALKVDLAETSLIALERLSRGPSASPTWALYCPEGKVTITQDSEKKDYQGPVTLLVSGTGNLRQSEETTPPFWVSETEPSAADRELRTQFLRAFRPGRPILAEVVTATEETQPSIRRLAIVGLTTLGDLSYVIPLLDRKDAPEVRRDAIAAIRSYMAYGTDNAQRAGEQLREEFDESTGRFAEKLLSGYSAEEASKPETLRNLVNALGADTPSVGIRELSLDNLMRISGRDSLGYDPDSPNGEGLNSWKKLLSEGKLSKEKSSNESSKTEE